MTVSRPDPLVTARPERGTGALGGGPAGLLDRAREPVLALFRIVVGLLFACHGAATLFDILGGPHGGVPEFGAWPGWWAAAIELVGGSLVLLGAWTRFAAVICSGSMAYAYFTVHQTEALFPIENGGEASAMFCWAFLLIAVLGPGRWAVDSLFAGKDTRKRPDDDPALAV